jgi:hypothetical protein
MRKEQTLIQAWESEGILTKWSTFQICLFPVAAFLENFLHSRLAGRKRKKEGDLL